VEGRSAPSLIGAAVQRVEDRRLLTGRGRFVADLTRPGMLHAAFLRSPHAHARIGRIDTAAARAAPGVVAVMTGPDLAPHARPIRALSRMAGYTPTDMPALACDKARYVGEAAAVVVAESRYAAEDAVERIAVEWDPLEAVTDPRAGAGAGPPVHDAAPENIIVRREFAHGNVAAAFAGSPIRVGDRFRFHRHAAVAIENRSCLAEWEPGADTLTLFTSTQVPGMIRDALADLLGLPAHRVRVVAPDVGGGFGMKSALYPEELALSAVTRILGRPVKWVGDRREDLLTSTQAWDEDVEAELAVNADGTIGGLRAEVWADVGAYSIHPWTASIEVIQVVSFLPGPYRVPHYRGVAWGIATNKAPMGPYRGVGRPVSTFVMEALLDRAARRLDMDPKAIRLANLVAPDEMPYRSASGLVWDSGRFAESLERACETAGYESLRAEQQDGRRAGRRRVGVGIASYVELTGVGSAIPASPGADIATGTEGATVRVDPGGTVTAAFGLACHGQGHETTLAQVVAEELGAELHAVRVVHGDTDAGPAGSGTYASRSAVIGGGAAILASRAVRDKALLIAAHRLEADVRDLELSGGVAWVRGAPARRLTLADIARSAYAGIKRLPKGMEPGLEATRFYDPYIGTAASASHVAVVEVDLDLCSVALRRYVVVEDCGRIINPMIVDGQAVGGVAQGLGAALLEEVAYDESAQLLNGSLMDYLIPTAAELPRIEVLHADAFSPSTLGGFKGVGEGGTIGAPAAIANAVADAVAPLGIEITEVPITPERLFRLVSAAASRRPLT
jgi:carbon-monoxide dehydrogenase large subunit